MANADGISLRPATSADAGAIAGIYRHHVLEGTATFEEVPPTTAEMADRIEQVMTNGYPWLVAHRTGNIVGYAYAGPFHRRSAYRFTVEDSIYLAADEIGQGIGSRLLAALIADCNERGFTEMMAVIGDSANMASIGLHRAHGFRLVGTATDIGFKFGRRLDVIYMQRSLAPSPSGDRQGGDS